jgi:hypothetical protein
MMTLQKTVEIPVDHRLFIDVPQEIPAGTAHISIIFNGFDDDAYGVKKYKSLAAMRGCCKGLDTMDEYFARKNADKEKEKQQERRYV